MSEFKTRRGLALKAPSPFEKQPAPKVHVAPKKATRVITDPVTRRNFFRARIKLGLSANTSGYIRWGNISKTTTFKWKFETLEQTAGWMIKSAWRDFHRLPTISKRQIALHYCFRAFGITPSDILGDSRSAPIVAARHIAMLTLLKAGVGRADTAGRFKRDHTTITAAKEKYNYLFEGLSYAEFAKDTSDGRPASDGQSDGELPASTDGGLAGDHQEAKAGELGDPGGSDRGEGSA